MGKYVNLLKLGARCSRSCSGVKCSSTCSCSAKSECSVLVLATEHQMLEHLTSLIVMTYIHRLLTKLIRHGFLITIVQSAKKVYVKSLFFAPNILRDHFNI